MVDHDLINTCRIIIVIIFASIIIIIIIFIITSLMSEIEETV